MIPQLRIHSPQLPAIEAIREEALNPLTGGPALGQGQPVPAEGTIGQGPADRQVVPSNAQPDDAAKPVPPKNQ